MPLTETRVLHHPSAVACHCQFSNTPAAGQEHRPWPMRCKQKIARKDYKWYQAPRRRFPQGLQIGCHDSSNQRWFCSASSFYGSSRQPSNALSRVTTAGMVGLAAGSCAQQSLHSSGRCRGGCGSSADVFTRRPTPSTSFTGQRQRAPDELAVGAQAGKRGGIRAGHVLWGWDLQA